MKIYAFIITVLALVFLIGYIKYRISTFALTYLLTQKYTLPTDKELKECTEKVIKHWFGMD